MPIEIVCGNCGYRLATVNLLVYSRKRSILGLKGKRCPNCKAKITSTIQAIEAKSFSDL